MTVSGRIPSERLAETPDTEPCSTSSNEVVKKLPEFDLDGVIPGRQRNMPMATLRLFKVALYTQRLEVFSQQ